MKTYTFHAFMPNGEWKQLPEMSYNDYRIQLQYCIDNHIPYLSVSYDEPEPIENVND